MKEFIVWSNELKQFSESLTLKEMLKDICETWDIYEVEECDYFEYIGIDDITDRKIYADCSIVEMYRGLDSFVGYYTYNKNKAHYEFIILNGCDNDSFGNIVGSSLKIIDTIQENKLGLIK